MKQKRDSGYALLVAVVGIAAFAYVAFEAVEATRGAVASAEGEFAKARLSAAADAGLAIAIQGLGAEQVNAANGAWSIDGRAQTLSFNGMMLRISVEDERGKVPINALNETQVRQLFAAAGATGTELDTLTDSLDDWLDDDAEVRQNGAEDAYYSGAGLHPRNGALATVDELAGLKGMNPYLFARIAPAATTFFGDSGGFNQADALPLALRAMSASSIQTPEELEREREAAGETPAFDLADQSVSLIGRTLTVRVNAEDGHGGSLTRATIIELTGNPAQPYWIRYRG